MESAIQIVLLLAAISIAPQLHAQPQPQAERQQLQSRIEYLKLEIAKQPHRIDLMYSLTYLYEKAGRYAEAIKVAGRILGQEETYDARLRLGWLNLQAQKYPEAIDNYKRAAELAPKSEEAWLGLQRAYMAAEKWEQAAQAGDRVLRLNRKSWWGLSRQAYVRFVLGDYERAEQLYLRAINERPEDAEMLLGLGFTKLRLGDEKTGKAYCRDAGRKLKDDPRVQQCLDWAPEPGILISASLYAAYLRYTDPWDQRDLKATTGAFGLKWPWGLGLWLGATWSEIVLNYETDNFRQINPVLGASYAYKGFSAAASGTILFNNDEDTDRAKVFLAGAGYDGAFLGGGIDYAVSFYPDFSAHQIDPRLRIYPHRRLIVTAGPELIMIRTTTTEAQSGRGMGNAQGRSSTDTDSYWSGHLGLSVIAASFWTAFVEGYYGYRIWAVDARGLSVWSNDDRFFAGYRVGSVFGIGDHVDISAEFRHDFGDRQLGTKHDFALYGGTLGVVLGF